MRRRAALALVVAAALGLGLSTGSAASLTVQAGHMGTASAQACTSATLAATRTQASTFFGIVLGYRGVRLAVPTQCAGTDISVTLYNGTTVVATATATDVVAGNVNMTTSAYYGGLLYTNANIVLTLDGWSVPATF